MYRFGSWALGSLKVDIGGRPPIPLDHNTNFLFWKLLGLELSESF